jgi:predicted enzyme related to lactoylglutathione lyase
VATISTNKFASKSGFGVYSGVVGSNKRGNHERIIIMSNRQPLRGIATISFFAADHAAAKQWYTDFLGMAPYFDRPGYFEFRLGDHQQELGVIDSQYMPSYDTLGHDPSGAVVYWHVDDMQGTIDRLVALGATPLNAPQDRGEGFITASVRDPFGNVLGLMHNPHYLAVRGEETAGG